MINPVLKPIKEDKLLKKIAKMKEQNDKKFAKMKERLNKAKPKKKVNKESMKYLRDTAWKLFSKVVREEEHYICFTCGKNLQDDKSKCHAGHYVPRGKVSALRYDRKNVHAQCINCNMYLSGNLSVYAIKLEEKYGFGILQEFDKIREEEDLIRQQKAPARPLTREMLYEMIEFYKLCLESLGIRT